jgi:tetratricopeptide (TPR) repeat protein
MNRERLDDSYEAYMLCRAVSEHLVKLEPGNQRYRREDAVGDATLGNVETKRGNWAEADVHYEMSEEKMRQLLLWDPDNRRWLTDLGNVLLGWRDSCRAREDWERALTLNEELIGLHKKLLEGDGERIEPYFNLSMSQRAHAEILDMLPDRWADEVAWLRESEKTLAAGVAKDASNNDVRYQLGGAANWLASVLVEREEGREEAIACLDRAKAIWLGMEDDEKLGEWVKTALEGQAALYAQARGEQ